MKKLLKKRRGFTLIEMTIVLFIISLLILIIIPNISRARQSAQNIHGNAMVSVVQSQIDAYFEDNPHQKSVDYDTLQSQGYLTGKQTYEAEHEEGIQIVKENKNNSTNVIAEKNGNK